MRLKHIIKCFSFEDSQRSTLTLGAGISQRRNAVQLKPVETNGLLYPTTANLSFRTRLTNPKSLKQWVGFVTDITHFRNATQTIVTSARYRLSTDGVNDLYWDGLAWSTAGASDWNTEAEIAANISTFPVSNQSVQVVVNLATTDANFTPIIKSIRLLYTSDLEELDDVLWKSLVGDMRAKIRPIAEHRIKPATATATLDLNTFKYETKYDLQEIDAVYDFDADPNLLVDLYQSYDANSKIITLNATIPAGNRTIVRFTYRPQFAVQTDQDYREQSKRPSVTIENVRQTTKREGPQRDFVFNKADPSTPGKAVQISAQDIEMAIVWHAGKGKDNSRLGTEIRRYFQEHPLLRSIGTDDDYRLWMHEEPADFTTPKQDGGHTGQIRARIVNVSFFDRAAADVRPVTGFSVNYANR